MTRILFLPARTCPPLTIAKSCWFHLRLQFMSRRVWMSNILLLKENIRPIRSWVQYIFQGRIYTSCLVNRFREPLRVGEMQRKRQVEATCEWDVIINGVWSLWRESLPAWWKVLVSCSKVKNRLRLMGIWPLKARKF